MDNIKQVVKDIRFLIATDCRDETLQSRIENFINEREQALRIHNVSRRSEQLFCDCEIKGSSFQLNTGEICCCKCEKERAK
jgi:hypothetical protein